MSKIQLYNLLFGGVDVGKINNLFFSGLNLCLMLYCANYFRLMMLNKNKKKKDSESKTTSPLWIYVLMILVPFCRSLSLLLKLLCSPSLPLTIACKFLSESPMFFLFSLVCNGWPLVKPLLLHKDKLLLVGVVLIECLLVPALSTLAAYSSFQFKFKYTSNQFILYESFDLFRFIILFLSYKSSTHYLKKKGISSYGQACTSFYYIQLFFSLLGYYSDYCILRCALAYFSIHNLFLHELLFMVLCVAFANKFILELLDIDGLLPDDDGDDSLLDDDNAVDDDQEIAAIKALAEY